MDILLGISSFIDKIPAFILLGSIWFLFRRIYVLEKDFLEENKSWTSTCVPALVASVVPATLFHSNFFELIPAEFRLLWISFCVATVLIIFWMLIIYVQDIKKHRDVKNVQKHPFHSF